MKMKPLEISISKGNAVLKLEINQPNAEQLLVAFAVGLLVYSCLSTKSVA
jgi:hypothetical protein